MKTPAKRRTGEVTASNVSTEQTWCTGKSAYTGESITSKSAYRIPTFHTTDGYTGDARTDVPATGDRRPATGDRRVAYQIPTFNTTDWYTGEAAYRRPATGDRRVAVSDSNVQHNRLVHCRSGVPATGNRQPATGESPYQIPTFNTTYWYTGELAY